MRVASTGSSALPKVFNSVIEAGMPLGKYSHGVFRQMVFAKQW